MKVTPVRVLQLMASNGFYGAERIVTLLSRRLMSLGCEVTIGLFNAANSSQQDFLRVAEKDGIAVWDFPCKRRIDFQLLTKLTCYLKNEKIDILHTHGYKANLYGLIAARLAGCTAIATCHNWTNRTSALRRYGSLDKFLLRGFDSVVAVSDTVASTLTVSGFPAAKLRIIPNGIDTAHYRISQQQQASETPMVLGALSRLSEEKGIDVLVRALPRILAVRPELQCIVAGEGTERSQLLKLAAEIGVEDHLQLPGFCSDTAGFLASCSIVVHPSRVDGMPLAILEAMAAGRPIVASAVGNIPALLRDGQAGVLVPSDDPIGLADGVLWLIADQELRKRCGAQAALHAREYFDSALMGDRYMDMYRGQGDISGAAGTAVANMA